MEPITQALLGAATAELVAGKALRGRALGWGAAIGMSPDLDVLLGPLRDGYGEWLYHRGTTHSLWFGFVVGPILGWALWRWRDPGRVDLLRPWIVLCVVALVTHPLLDGFTPYGTQFFAPFSRERIAWNGVAIVDPFYSVMLAAGVLAAATRRYGEATRRKLLALSLVLSTAYLIAGLGIHRAVVADLRGVLAREGATVWRVRAYPTIFQPWLRSFVAHDDDAIYVGLHSWMEWGCPSWRRHPRPEPDPALTTLLSSPEGRLLTWFADGDIGFFYIAATAAQPEERLRIEDLRYAWADAEAHGMWGIEAPVEGGRVTGPIRRIPRQPPAPGDFARIADLLRGRLPVATKGWQRPADCLRARR